MTKIASKHQKKISRQEYSKKEAIEGVKVLGIESFVTEDGTFNEVVRMSKGKITKPADLSSFEVVQINHSLLEPGTRKAWHLHEAQDEVWFVHPSSRVIVGLLDVRKKSPTQNKVMRLVLGGGKTHLVYIPRGVAHGVSNPYTKKEATMTYLMNNTYDGTDELRLPFDYGVSPDFWEMQKG